MTKRLTLLLALLSLCTALWGRGLRYEVVTPPQGLPSSVTCVLSDPGSFVWMGTSDGLLRLDYRHYKLYTYGSAFSIPGNRVRSLTRDTGGNVFVMTDRGIARYRPETDDFETLSGLDAVSYSTTAKGVMFGGRNAVQFYDSAAGTFGPVRQMDPTVPFNVDYIFPYGEDYLVLDLDRGFLRYSPSSDTFLQAPLNITGSSCAFLDSRLRFWRSVYNEGVECYDVTGRLIDRYDMSNSGLTSNLVTGFAESMGRIWVSTRNGSVCMLNPETREVESLMGPRSDVNRFPSNDLSGIFSSSDGIVWAVRSRGGVIAIRPQYFQSYYISPVLTTAGGVSQNVRCFSQAPGEKLMWLGTGSAGLHSIRLSDGHVEWYPSVGSKSVTAMANMPDGKLLLYSYADGLYVFNKADGHLSRFQYSTPSLDLFIRKSGNPVRLGNSPDGKVVIVADAVYLYDPATRTAKVVKVTSHDFSDRLLPVFGASTSICHDSRSFGLFIPSEGEFRQTYDIGENIVRSAAEAPDGTVWTATSRGLGWLDPSSGKYVPVETDLFHEATTIACDHRGRVWVGAEGNLFVYNPSTESFLALSESDGVLQNDFNPEARFVTPDGYLLLGGSGGLCVVDLSVSFDNTEVPEISLLEAYVDDKPVTQAMPRILPSGTKAVTLRVLAREADILRHKTFRFHITGPAGLDETIDSEESAITLRYRDHGSYTVSASCTMPNGAWTEPVEIYSWRLNPVWYRNAGLVLSLLALLVLTAIYVIYSHSQRTLQRAMHEADTDRIHFLLNVSHELKTPLTLIIGPLERVLGSLQKTDPLYVKISGAYRQAMRMRTLILTVLDAHKIEEGAATLNAEKVDFNSWVRDIALQFADEMDARNIQMICSFDARVSDVEIDAPKLENVLTNLLVNAMKHSTNDTTVTVGTELRGSQVRTYVSDTGSGLNGVDTEKLFSRYYQGLTEKTGSGMGLAYANTIVELHSGSMGARGNEGPGATFWFDIPIRSNA